MRALVAALALWAAAAAPVRAQTPGPVPCARCGILVLRPGQAVLVPQALNDVEILVRGDVEGLPSDRDAVLRAAMATVRDGGGQPGLLLPGVDAPLPGPATMALAQRIVIDVSSRTNSPEFVFALKSRLTDLRAAGTGQTIGILGPPDLLRALLTQDLGSYLDFLVSAGGPPPPYPLNAAGLRLLGTLESAPGGRAGGTMDRWLLELPADALQSRQLFDDVAAAAAFLPEGLVAGGAVDVQCGGSPVPTFLDPGSLDTVAIARRCDGGRVVVSPADRAVRTAALSDGDVLVRVDAAEGRFAEGVRVVGARDLTVREIVARHQAAAARQRRAVRQLVSTGTLTLTFEAPGFPAPIAITSTAVIYADADRTDIEQRDIRVNGIAFQAGGVPRLPLLEPERVASPPLAIALTDVYRYRLEGRDTIAGVPCFVVGFEPTDANRPLFRGRAWIAADSFAMVRVAAVQTGLRGPIVTSEQTDEFRREADGVWLLARSETRQIYEGAGHRTPIHRVLAIGQQQINPDGFEARRASAYASPSIMLRDTPEGFRYLLRQPAIGDGVRVAEPSIAKPADRVRTVAVGVIVDPNISQPLPFAGLSYVDFDLFGTGAQLNAFFGGTYGQLAFSVPSLGGSRWQLAGRAFGIASSYNDRAFVAGREIYAANIAQRPAHASVGVLRPLNARFTVRAAYEFDYTHFARNDSTAPAFRLPADQAAHALRLSLDGQWSGWTASGWWAGIRRQGWRAWGQDTSDSYPLAPFDPRQRDYQRFGGAVGRSVVLSPRLVGRAEASWMTGHDLDRFSRYTFGSFDNRLRGYPSALLRYDRGLVVRSTAAWSAGRVLRLDGFVDGAFVRDPGFGRDARPYAGIGAAAEVPAPFGTLLAVEWGYGFQGIDSTGGRGTQVVRISGYKMF